MGACVQGIRYACSTYKLLHTSMFANMVCMLSSHCTATCTGLYQAKARQAAMHKWHLLDVFTCESVHMLGSKYLPMGLSISVMLSCRCAKCYGGFLTYGLMLLLLLKHCLTHWVWWKI